MLTSWQVQNLVEANYKQYYGWLLGTHDLQGLFNLAQQCPQSNGAVVNYARTLYNSLTHKTIVFENKCGSAILTPVKLETPVVTLHPNPAKSSVKVKCENARRIDIFNVQGQCLVSKNVFASNNILETRGLTKGIYLVRITTDKGKIVSSKLIVE